jgi:glyoxylase-like metal-dependent hydrolase (beta-lactamase superfamily II)
LKLVIITHGDFDHTGNCAKLKEKYRAKIAIHQDDAFMTENGMRIKSKVSTLAGKIILLFLKLWHRNLIFYSFKPDIFLTDGQSLEEYGFNAKVIHIPGHTKGSIGILTADGDLFAGDTLINLKKPDIGICIENEQYFRNSIDKLKKLNIKKIYPGHGNPFLA